MAVSYKRLFKMLIDKDIKKMDFCEQTGIGRMYCVIVKTVVFRRCLMNTGTL